MGAIKPWHVLVLSLCCLLSFTVVAAGVLWAVLSKRRGSGR
ncbi:hypothetical protein [Plantactinospora sp. CA-290183]